MMKIRKNKSSQVESQNFKHLTNLAKIHEIEFFSLMYLIFDLVFFIIKVISAFLPPDRFLNILHKCVK